MKLMKEKSKKSVRRMGLQAAQIVKIVKKKRIKNRTGNNRNKNKIKNSKTIS